MIDRSDADARERRRSRRARSALALLLFTPAFVLPWHALHPVLAAVLALVTFSFALLGLSIALRLRRRMLLALPQLFAVVALIGGCVVSAWSHPEEDPITHTYQALQLFAGESTWTGRAFAAAADSPAWTFAIHAVRIAALLATVSLILTLFNRYHRVVLRLASHRDGHVLVCGLGEVGFRFVEAWGSATRRGDRPDLLIVENDPANPNIDRCLDAGHAVIVGNAFDRIVLGRLARADRAAYIIHALPTDELNVELSMEVRALCKAGPSGFWRIVGAFSLRRARPPRLLVHVDDSRLARHVQDHNRLGPERRTETRFFSVDEIEARAVLAEHPPEFHAEILDAPGIHLALYGRGRMVETLMEQALHVTSRPFAAALRLTVFVPEATAAADERALRHRFRESIAHEDLQLSIHPLTASEGSLPDIALDAMITADEPTHPPTQHFVCLDDPRDASSLALSLREQLRARAPLVRDDDRVLGWNAPVFVRLKHRRGLYRIFGEIEREGMTLESPDGLYPFGALADALQADELFSEDRDRIARAFHEFGYRRQREQGIARANLWRQTTAVDWVGLSLFHKRSNRSQADQLPARLRAVRCAIAPADPPQAAPAKERARLEHPLLHEPVRSISVDGTGDYVRTLHGFRAPRGVALRRLSDGACLAVGPFEGDVSCAAEVRKARVSERCDHFVVATGTGQATELQFDRTPVAGTDRLVAAAGDTTLELDLRARTLRFKRGRRSRAAARIDLGERERPLAIALENTDSAERRLWIGTDQGRVHCFAAVSGVGNVDLRLIASRETDAAAPILAIAVDAEGTHLALGDNEGRVHCMDAKLETELCELALEAPVTALRWRGTSRLLVGFDAGTAADVSVPDGERRRLLATPWQRRVLEGRSLFPEAESGPDDWEQLARLEHDRWARFHRAANWRAREHRADAIRAHAFLVPWSALAADTRAYDGMSILRTPALLDHAFAEEREGSRAGVVREVFVGVSRSTPAPPGWADAHQPPASDRIETMIDDLRAVRTDALTERLTFVVAARSQAELELARAVTEHGSAAQFSCILLLPVPFELLRLEVRAALTEAEPDPEKRDRAEDRWLQDFTAIIAKCSHAVELPMRFGDLAELSGSAGPDVVELARARQDTLADGYLVANCDALVVLGKARTVETGVESEVVRWWEARENMPQMYEWHSMHRARPRAGDRPLVAVDTV